MIIGERDIKRLKNKPGHYGAGQAIVEYILLLALLTLVVLTGTGIAGGGFEGWIDGVIDGIRGNGQPTEEATPQPETEEDYTMDVRPISDAGDGITGVQIHVFESLGDYLDLTATTGSDGQTFFTKLGDGAYAFRADYQAHEFWSQFVSFPAQTYVEIETGLRPIRVKVINASGTSLSEIDIHVFNSKDQFTGVSSVTNTSGLAEIDLVNGVFKIRAEYRGQAHWSEIFTTPGQTYVEVEISEAPFTIQVVDKKNTTISGIPVYAFNKNGGYTGIHGTTDLNGQAILDLPNGEYKFRADYEGADYWSDFVFSPNVSSTTIKVGQLPTQVLVANQAGSGIAGVTVYAFRGNGNHYTGDSAITDENGYAEFDLKNGAYSFRADYKNFTYWSDLITVPKESLATIHVDEGPVTVAVIDKRNNPVTDGVYVYAFSVIRDGKNIAYYFGGVQELDDNGIATFDLPQGEYRFMAYVWSGNNQFKNDAEWSDIISKPPTAEVTIRMK